MTESLSLRHLYRALTTHNATTTTSNTITTFTSTSTSLPALTRLLLPLILLLVTFYLWSLNRLLQQTPPQVARLVPQRWTAQQLDQIYARLEQQQRTSSSPPLTSAASYAAHIPPRLARRYIVTGGSGLVGGHIVLQLLERGTPPEAIRIVDFQPPHRADMVINAPPTAPHPHHPHHCEAVTRVPFFKTDIASATATEAAFLAPWEDRKEEEEEEEEEEEAGQGTTIAHRPLTVFHTAAVIIPSARSPLVNGFCEAVNVQGTSNVLAAARKAGADVVVATSSASIAIRPVRFWASLARPWTWWPMWPWESRKGDNGNGNGNYFPPGFWQVLDERDFFQPLRPHDEFFGNYAASKAKAERLVCGMNGPAMRTGCIRPGNGVYGHPTDNLLGTPLALEVYPTWVESVVQHFVHGINCALAHLQLEAILAQDPPHDDNSNGPQDASQRPQAGRPFCITDPGPPIYYGDLYHALQHLVTVTPFRLVHVAPVPMLLLSYAIEAYNLLPARLALLLPPALLERVTNYINNNKNKMKWWWWWRWPRLPGGAAHLQPGLFSICTHLLTDMRDAQRPVAEGGLGYRGVVSTVEGMCQEILEWNREQEALRAGDGAGNNSNNNGGLWNGKSGRGGQGPIKTYRTSVLLAEEIQKLGGVASG